MQLPVAFRNGCILGVPSAFIIRECECRDCEGLLFCPTVTEEIDDIDFADHGHRVMVRRVNLNQPSEKGAGPPVLCSVRNDDRYSTGAGRQFTATKG